MARQKFPMFVALESLPLAIIAVSFAAGFVAGMLVYPLTRLTQK
jgi:hypothetical protein